jgi:hypothetical protein
VQAQGLGVAAHPARLDVDDSTGADLDGFRRGLDRVDRFVEADRGSQEALQARVIADVVVVEWLSIIIRSKRSSSPSRGASARVCAALASTISGMSPNLSRMRATASTSHPG